MDPANERQHSKQGESRFLDFPTLPDDAKDDEGNPRLNKYSATITRGHDFPGAQVRHYYLRCAFLLTRFQAMLYAAGVPDRKTMLTAPHVGIASVWWEGNPCK
jgi:dihydroxy-acid dehydratase